MDPGMRIDLQNTVTHNFYFLFSDRFSGRNDLTVQICQADFIVIDQIKSTDSASCQCFCCITADTAQSENCNSRICQAFHCLFSIKKLCSRKLI